MDIGVCDECNTNRDNCTETARRDTMDENGRCSTNYASGDRKGPAIPVVMSNRKPKCNAVKESPHMESLDDVRNEMSTDSIIGSRRYDFATLEEDKRKNFGY
jgi:hypothetical protein